MMKIQEKMLVLFAVLSVASVAFADSATITWRVHVGMWRKDQAFDEFVSFVRRHRLTGKFAFFSCATHTPPRLETFMRDLGILKKRMAAMKALGYEAGINHLVTLGHVDESLDNYEDIPEAQRFTGYDGRRAMANYCPCDPIWRERYLKTVYGAMAKSGADFIWTDDDIRLQNHGIKGWGCFCPVCMKKLEKIGYVGDREGFAAWLEDPKEGDGRRRAYLQFRRETVADLLGFVAETVRTVNPAVVVGVMDCGNNDQTAFPEKFAALKGDRYPIYWRPGGEVWDDLLPDAILDKVNAVARECAYIPDGVKCLEAELEDFNYQRLRKSVHYHLLESDLYTAVCTRGVAYNVFCPPALDGLDVSGDLVDALEGNRTRLESLGSATAYRPCRGVYAANGRNADLGRWTGDGAAWLSGDHPSVIAPFVRGDIQKIGLPTAYRAEYAAVWAADGVAVRSMTDEEIVRMLSTGAYLSGDAAAELIRRGYGADVGFDVTGIATGAEVLVEHPLNGADAGKVRVVCQSFWGGQIETLKPLPGATVTSRLVDSGREVASCVSGCFENSRGGRVFVAGCFAWDRLLWKNKTDQLKRVFRWLSCDRLPGYVESYHRVALWLRGDDAVVIFNMSADPARNLKLMLAGEAKSLVTVGEKSSAKVIGKPVDAYCRYDVPEIAPWSVLVMKGQSK